MINDIQIASLIVTGLLVVAAAGYVLWLYFKGYLSFLEQRDESANTSKKLDAAISNLLSHLGSVNASIQDLTKKMSEKTSEETDKKFDEIKNCFLPMEKQIKEVSDAIRNDLENQMEPARASLARIEQKEHCCFKEKLKQNDVPDVLEPIKEHYESYQYIKDNVMNKLGIPSLETLESICSFVDWLEKETIPVPDDQSPHMPKEQVEVKNWIKTVDDLKKRINQFKEEEIDLGDKKIDLAAKEKRIEEMETQHNKAIADYDNRIELFAPKDIFNLFGHRFDDCSVLKASHPKQLMAIYSYLSLLGDFHVFPERFRGFDRDLRAAFDGEELTEIRRKVQNHLNPIIESQTNFRIEWPLPGSFFNSDCQTSSSSVGQTISDVISATIYKRDDRDKNKWICNNKGKVETA